MLILLVMIVKLKILNQLTMMNSRIVDQSVQSSVVIRNGFYPRNDIFLFSHVEGFDVSLMSLGIEFFSALFQQIPFPPVENQGHSCFGYGAAH